MKTDLGWLALCLNVADIHRSMEFYGKLDFVRVGGEPDEGWAVMAHESGEVHLFHGHIKRNILNFRGGDVRALAARFAERGLEPPKGVLDESDGCTSATYTDPDGIDVYFDTHPTELARFAAGERFTCPGTEELLKPDPLLLGNFCYCLNCADLGATRAFYEKLGLTMSGGEPEQGWAILTVCEPPEPKTIAEQMHLGLFAGHIDRNLLNFRGGDCFAIAEVLKERGVEIDKGPSTHEDGSGVLFFDDPDGNQVFINTYPQERMYE